MSKFISTIILTVLFLSTPSFADTIITTFSGNGNRSTRPFSISDKWEIQWNAKGIRLNIFLHTADGNNEGLVARQEGPGIGKTYQPKGGDYYLDIIANGRWVIDVVQIDSVSPKKSDYERVESYKNWQPYKDYLKLPESYHSPAMEKSYKDSYEAERIVKNLLCSKGGTLGQYFSKKPEPPIDDLGWNEFPGENGVDVIRTFLLNPFESLEKLEYKWHVDSMGKVTAINDEAYGITKWEKGNNLNNYKKTKTTKPSGEIYRLNDTIHLHNPADTVVAIYNDETLGYMTNLFANGIAATITDYKTSTDKPTAYKVLVTLEDGTEHTGWVSETVIGD